MQGYVLFVTPEHAGMASSGEVSLVMYKDFEIVSLKEMLGESGKVTVTQKSRIMRQCGKMVCAL